MTIRELIRKVFVGKSGTRCAECGALVAEGEGYRVPFMVFCCEDHAVEWQMFQAP